MGENIYYVYEWIRLDTNEPFYVGKGCGGRCYSFKGRNQYFNNMVNSSKNIPIAVNILHDNLDEQTAYDLECWYINEYKYIIGYNLVNINDGGEGGTLCGENHPNWGKHLSEETKKKMSDANKGENHPFYGKHHSEESKKKISENHADMSGTNNPMFGKNYRDFMTEEELKEHDRRISKANKGENHPLWGKHHSEETKKKMSDVKKGKNHPKATAVICLTTKRIFFTAKEGGEYYGCDGSSIIKCCKGRYKSCGKLPDGTKLVWRYLVWEHNKKFKIKG